MLGRCGICLAAKRTNSHFFSVSYLYLSLRDPTARRHTFMPSADPLLLSATTGARDCHRKSRVF